MAKKLTRIEKSKTKDNDEKKELEKEQSVLFQFSEEEQKKIANMVAEDFDSDKASRTEYNNQIEEILFLYEGKRAPKNDPWPNCSNVNTMITAVVIELIHSKLLPAIWNEELLDWRCDNTAFKNNTENIKKFMGWAMRDANFAQIVDDLAYNSILLGTTAHKVRKVVKYKWVQRKIPVQQSILEKAGSYMGLPVTRKYTTEYEYIQDIKRVIDDINIEDLYFPYNAKDEQECDHLIHRFYITYPEALELEKRGYWKNIEEKLQPVVDEIILEGKSKEDLDSEGVSKVETKRDNKPLSFLEWQGKYDFNKDGILEECVFTVHYNEAPYGSNATYVAGKPLSAVSRTEKRNIVIGSYIRRSNRLLGKGVGHLVANLHKHIDSFYNQKNDAGTISIIPFGFYTPASGFDPDEIELVPGGWYPVDDVNGIKWVTPPNNTGMTWQDIQFLISIIERLTSATPYMQGRESETVKSGATATSTIALIQEGQSMFVKTARRVARTVAKIAELLLESYQEDMPPGLAEKVTGKLGEELFPDGLSPEDIAGNYSCYLDIDTLSLNKSIRRQVDLQIYTFALTNPIVMSNPTYLWELTAMALRSLEKSEEQIEKIIGPRPNLTFAELNDAKEENIQMMNGNKVKVDMNEPLFEHLVTHMAFRGTQVYKDMEPEHKVIVDEHIEDTKMALTMQMRVLQMQQTQGGQNAPTAGQVQPGVSTGTDENINTVGGMEGAGAPVRPIAPTTSGTPLQITPGKQPRPSQIQPRQY